ncbi:MAG: hypothetical protein GC168_20115 [Candidatus Hydrogenedens sp.]|nr:hypothetical protein [Candidatus Hydrogenedens sp.]
MRAVKRRLAGGLVVAAMLAIGASAGHAAEDGSFINFETAHVSPMAMSPDGATLAVCNTADNRVEIFSLTSGTPVATRSIPVGLDPVSVRFRNNVELWCVNQISDSVSIIDLGAGGVVATVQTEDEPADVVFAGNPRRAYVSCSQTNNLLVFHPDNLGEPLYTIPLNENAPRTLQTDATGSKVYVAFFDAGNITAIDGAAEDPQLWPWAKNSADNVNLPYGGANPSPQMLIIDEAGNVEPLPENPELPPWPRSSLIMVNGRPEDFHDWEDGQRVSFLNFISGLQAPLTGRPVGWDRTDFGLGIVNTATRGVSYIKNLNLQNMSMAVNPVTGVVAIAGFRGHPYIRFEPSLQGNFTQINVFLYDPKTGQNINHNRNKVNAHIGKAVHIVSEAERQKSLGDPRGMAWRGDGKILYLSGMGSNNLVTMNEDGKRAGVSGDPFTIDVGEGPTGVVMDDARGQLYVLNRFAASVSVVETETDTETAEVGFYDPTPEVIRVGRRHFYNTQENSGTGMVSCASCHIDGKSDKLPWNLGVPHGDMLPLFDEANPGGGIPGLADDLEDWHPVKGDMMTQTLQDIIGKEPFHWRGDRRGIEEFNPAFVGLLGRDTELTEQEMAEFKAFLATIAFPPNPNRELDNSLPTALLTPGLLTAGTFGPARQLLPAGNAQRGLELFRTALPEEGRQIRCIDCHTLPTGMGTNYTLNESQEWEELPPGPNGEAHHAMVSITGQAQKNFKVPQLRSVREKLGFDLQAQQSMQGSGFMHDGTLDTLPRLLSAGHFAVAKSDQDVADLAAFLMAFSGSDFPESTDPTEPPGTPSLDAHAAVGYQVTLDATTSGDDIASAIDQLLGIQFSDRVVLTARWIEAGVQRGAVYESGSFLTDRSGDTRTFNQFLSLIETTPVTFTIVAAGTETRIARDRDEDGVLDYDEDHDYDPDGKLTADRNGDYAINLSEVLRVVQFFNAGGLHCPATEQATEDGFFPGAGADHTCDPHDSDYSPQDWMVSINELLRTIQYFNAQGYYYCPVQETEDGFCPGVA